ncbi:unnamed protein product [Dibothriocephalus latus]|uniref:Cryptochrome/DNA photolyase FAD-binding domain-containing protein n=1 Tax=Dibothriocephalus latus TaxID=60516 RepID=A0A3P7LE87_DIBLA|nr:unnamed protein product [Dibothriocephalus latus]
MPKQYIYAPWTAPLAVQEKAGCVVGVDYAAPIVDHQEMRAANLVKMKAAYDARRTAASSSSNTDTAHNSSNRETDTPYNSSNKKTNASPSIIGWLRAAKPQAKKRREL